MLVVSDASPINILVRIHYIETLPKLFRIVVIPPAVERELSRSTTPRVVRDWLAGRPGWLQVRTPAHVDPTLTRDPGEREAICLACELKPDAILLDDLRARHIAERLGLIVTGTIGVLDMAAQRDLISLPEAIEAIRGTDFRVSDALLTQVLQEDINRKSGRGPK